jgi:hypothetical protein
MDPMKKCNIYIKRKGILQGGNSRMKKKLTLEIKKKFKIHQADLIYCLLKLNETYRYLMFLIEQGKYAEAR